MLDIASSIDKGFTHIGSYPQVPMIFFPVDDFTAHRDRLFGKMNSRLRAIESDVAEWTESGQKDDAALAARIEASPNQLTPRDVQRLLYLSEFMDRHALEVTDGAVKFIRFFRKKERQWRRLGETRSSDFLREYASRYEAMERARTDFLTDRSDLYRALASRHDPRNKRSRVFETASDLIADLNSA